MNQTTEPPKTGLKARAMLVSLCIKKFSPRKTDKKVTKQVLDDHNAKEDAGRFNKRLLPKQALERIITIEGEARREHYQFTVPWTDEGVRILPSRSWLEYVTAARKKRAEFTAAVADFIAGYDDFVNDAKQELNGMFNPADYPDKETLKKRFEFRTDFLPFPDGADFRLDIPEEEMANVEAELAELTASVDKRVESAMAIARKDLWQRLAAPVAAMAKTLGNPETVIRKGIVQNIDTIVKILPTLNGVAGDPNIESIRELVQQHLAGFTKDELRDDKVKRAETAKAANEILERMKAFMPGEDVTTLPDDSMQMLQAAA